MEMMTKLSNFINNYENPFFVGSLVENRVLYVNKIASSTFGVTAETCDYEKIFSTSNTRLRDVIEEQVKEVSQTMIYNCTVTKGDGQSMVVDLQLGFFNEEKTEIFMEMISRKDVSKKMILFQVDKSLKPEAILDFDDDLTIYHCNNHFFQIFSAIKETFFDKYKNKLSNAFLSKETKLPLILHALHENDSYTLEVEMITATGVVKWYNLDFQRRKFDETGEKIMCYATCIDEKKKTECKLNTFSQYFDGIQSITGESLCVVDMKSKILRQTKVIADELGLPEELEGYPESLFHKIHPDDLDMFKEHFKNTKTDSARRLKIRIQTATGEFRWYEQLSSYIFDEEGEISEDLILLKGIQEEQAMLEDFNLLNQYFEAMKSISNESIYVIDVETRTLVQTGQVAQELGIPPEVPGYPESVYGLMHPDDLDGFEEFSSNALNGIGGRVSLRVIVDENQYRWYELISMIIKGNKGEPKKILGKMYNIQKEHDLKEEFSLVNQYFNAMQMLSKDILYRVEMNTMTLHHMVKSGQADRLGNVIPDYVNTFIRDKIFHPEDVERYLQESQEWFEGKREVASVRAAITSEKYEWYNISGEKIFDKDGNLIEVLGKMENIQERKDLEHKSTHDGMTGVLNKVAFEEAVGDILADSQNEDLHALIFIDLDDFKGVNDNLGHSFGDFLLTDVSQRLKKVVSDFDLVGRVGGDEFVVFLKSLDNESSTMFRANLLLKTLQKEFSKDGVTKMINGSLGVAIYPQHGSTYKELVTKSDLALYESKARGKNVVTLYKNPSPV